MLWVVKFGVRAWGFGVQASGGCVPYSYGVLSFPDGQSLRYERWDCSGVRTLNPTNPKP